MIRHLPRYERGNNLLEISKRNVEVARLIESLRELPESERHEVTEAITQLRL